MKLNFVVCFISCIRFYAVLGISVVILSCFVTSPLCCCYPTAKAASVGVTSSPEAALGVCFGLAAWEPVFLPQVMETCVPNGLLDLLL